MIFILSKDCNTNAEHHDWEELKVLSLLKINSTINECIMYVNRKPYGIKKPTRFYLIGRNNDILDNNLENLRFFVSNCFSQIKKNKTIFRSSILLDYL